MTRREQIILIIITLFNVSVTIVLTTNTYKNTAMQNASWELLLLVAGHGGPFVFTDSFVYEDFELPYITVYIALYNVAKFRLSECWRKGPASVAELRWKWG